MLDKWHKKEKPVFTGIARGIGGFAFNTEGAVTPSVSPNMEASGGIIFEYNDSGTLYRSHTFNAPGTFSLTNNPDSLTIDMLLVGGGGGGGGGNGNYGAGGGGAGAAVVVTDYAIGSGPTDFAVAIGAGGFGGVGGYPQGASGKGSNGGDTTFTNPSPEVITAKGGGGGATGNSPPSTPSTDNSANDGQSGGCGGGGGSYGAPPPIGTGQPGPTIQAPNQPTSISSGTLVNHAFAGGTGERGSHGANGGGGGAGAVGSNAAEGPNPPNADPGGDGGGWISKRL